MNTTVSLKQSLLEQEALVFSQIPGMDELRSAAASNQPEIALVYPDAAFALMILRGLHLGNREQDEIHQKAYISILRGEPISNVRFRYDRDQEDFLRRHNWD